jgi:hypothetical protein
MRYRLMATYQGVPYEAGIGPSDGDVVLFAACPPPEELGFEPATGHWRKQLRTQDVQALWESRPMGSYRGQRCMVLDDLGDRLHIAYLGHDAFQAQQLGYWQVDRGVFELVTPREDVTDVTEERSDYLDTAAEQAPDPQPGPGYSPTDYSPTDYGPTDYGPADYGPVTADYGPATGYSPATDYGPAGGYGPPTADLPAAAAASAPATPFPSVPFPSAAASPTPFPPSTFPSADFPSTDFPSADLPSAGGLAPIPPRPDPGASRVSSRPRPLSPDFGPPPGLGRMPRPLTPTTAEPATAARPPGPLTPGYTVMPTVSEAPLPLEAAAMRAASAAGHHGPADRGIPAPGGGNGGASSAALPTRSAAPPRPLTRPGPAVAADLTTPDLPAAPATSATMTATVAPPLSVQPLSAPPLSAQPLSVPPLSAPPLSPASMTSAPMTSAPMTASGMAPPPVAESGLAPPPMKARTMVPPPPAPGSLEPGSLDPGSFTPGALGPPSQVSYPAQSAPAGSSPDRWRRRRSAQSRMATQGIFTELASLAAIPAAAYAVGEEVDGALCLIETETGYEVFSAAGGARHEIRTFDDEESAYFYLFGVLAAEAVRTGLLIPHH